MTTIAAFGSATFTLTAQSVIQITLDAAEKAGFTVLRNGVLIASDRLPNTKNIGPYLLGDVVTIFSDGSVIDYDILSSFTGSLLTASATGATATFTAPQTRLLCTLSQVSGTVAQAVVDLVKSDGTVLGTFYYPQGTPRWIDLPTGNLTVGFNVRQLSGTSPVIGIGYSA